MLFCVCVFVCFSGGLVFTVAGVLRSAAQGHAIAISNHAHAPRLRFKFKFKFKSNCRLCSVLCCPYLFWT